ncbi:hypothetical protein BJ878DRAFT_516238 [Calycina marina]|uniref:Extracellular matrix protein n=1 Tax=Calycina marina TaxID=1763456 RepID=A0A9P7YYZ3_9HELO|nr:hypothetical protein BJ878DRAFT_516238 [Calycina marina]
MQFTTLLFAALAIFGAVSADTTSAAATLNITNTVVNGLTAGTPFTVTWGYAKGPVTLTLMSGLDANNLKTYGTSLTTDGSYPDGSFEFTPTADMPSNDYAFMVSDGISSDNYSVLWQYFGASNSSSSASGSATSTGTDSSAASSTAAPDSTSSGSASTTMGSTITSSETQTSAAGSSTTPTSTAPAIGSAAGISSPFAMVFLGVATFFVFN